jgi:hypothetical protein
MSNPETGRIPWKRILIEAIAIVASILIAFALDAWWDARTERAQERALLSALADDFEAAAASFNATKAFHLEELRASQEIIGYGESGGIPLADHAKIDTLVSHQFSRRMFDPPMGTVQSILGSGRIDLISNPELVTELTRWSTAVAALQRSEEDSRDHFYDQVFPYLSAHLDVEDLDKGFAAFVDFPWQQEPAGAYRLLSDQEFLNLIYLRWVLLQNVVTEFLDPVEESLIRVRAALDHELPS